MCAFCVIVLVRNIISFCVVYLVDTFCSKEIFSEMFIYAFVPLTSSFTILIPELFIIYLLSAILANVTLSTLYKFLYSHYIFTLPTTYSPYLFTLCR